jgi:hypothetical protein
MKQAGAVGLSWICFILLLTGSANTFAAPEAYPGALWGTASRDFNNIEGLGTMGFISQGVQWVTLPGDVRFQTYASYSWRFRSENRDYYDAHGPGLGLEFSWKFFNLGAVYESRKYPAPQPEQSSNNILSYLTWYNRFDFISPNEGSASFLGIPVLGFPTTTWGQVFRDFNQLEGFGTQGWLNQGIEWFRFSEVSFKTQATYRWRFRSEKQLYYDAHGPGLGVELSRKSIDLGLEYSWMRYPNLGTSTNDWHLYLTWYLDWDLKDRQTRPK